MGYFDGFFVIAAVVVFGLFLWLNCCFEKFTDIKTCLMQKVTLF